MDKLLIYVIRSMSCEISPTSFVSKRAFIGRNVKIGHFTVVHDNVAIEDGVTIGDHCSIGIATSASVKERVLRIGARSTIRSHAVIYEGSQLGEGFQAGHHVMIRENSVVGRYVSIGSFSDLEGDCWVGDCSRCHSYVHISKGTRVGRFVWLFSLVTLTNDALPPYDTEEPTLIKDGACVLVGCTVYPGTIMEEGCYAAAGSQVRGVVPIGQVVCGQDGAISGHVTGLIHRESRRSLPWMANLLHRYPEEFHDDLRGLHDKVMRSRSRK